MKALPRCRVRQPWRNGPELTPRWTTAVREDAERPAPLAPPCRGRGWFRELICATGLHNTSYNNSCSGMKSCWWLFSSHCFLGQVESHARSQTQFHQRAARPLQTVDMLKHLISARLILDAMLPPTVGIPILLRTNIWLWCHFFISLNTDLDRLLSQSGGSLTSACCCYFGGGLSNSSVCASVTAHPIIMFPTWHLLHG